ncbi:MAG TPA: 3'(2'),5'-bisphosphate nucleotidase CysQ [Aridibacter sp.]|nr:3'(2'),5'-bisphosphate nucleotidase CysQ [Aridibacter sp.]
MLERELETALGLALEAGAEIMKIYDEGFEVEEKFITETYSEPVTLADKTASKIIVRGIADEFPDDAVLSEEEPDDVPRRLAATRVWIVDPLDGTKGFTEKMGDFAVQIGLVVNGVPSVGVVFQPIGSRMFYGRKGVGAYLSENGGEAERLLVSEETEFENMTIAVSRSHRSPRMSRVFEHYGFANEFRHGSVGLKVGFIARRMADIYIHLSPYTKYWDTAAPQAILEEAGGTLTDLYGQRIDYTKKDVRNHNGILSTNGVSKDAAVAHLRPLLTEFGRVRVTKSK